MKIKTIAAVSSWETQLCVVFMSARAAWICPPNALAHSTKAKHFALMPPLGASTVCSFEAIWYKFYLAYYRIVWGHIGNMHDIK